jgi:SPP1 family predicted phage head-tail adaptor
MIHAGFLNERITLQAPAETRNRMGEVTLEWNDVAVVWASIQGLTTRDLLQAQQANVIATHRVVLRYFPTLTHEYRIVWRGRTLEVASVTERENRTRHELLVREVQ